MEITDYIPDLTGYNTYLEINGASRHTPSPEYDGVDWNQENPGIGLIIKKRLGNAIRSMMIGQYKNSLNENSNYIAAQYQKRLIGNDDFHIDAGGRAGLVTGYSLPVVPMLQPTLTIGGQNMDFNIGYQPRVDGMTPEVYMFNVDIPIGKRKNALRNKE